MVYGIEEFGNRLSLETDIGLVEARDLVRTCMDIMKQIMMEGDTIRITNFFTAGARRKKGWNGCHPRFGTQIKYADRIVPYLFFARQFRSQLTKDDMKTETVSTI